MSQAPNNQPQIQTVPVPIDVPVPSSDSGARSEGSIRWQLSANDIISELEHDLRGDDLNRKTMQWDEVKGMALLNNKGIRMVKSVMRSALNRNVFLSNLDEDRILMFCYNFELDLIDMVVLKHEEWHLDKANCDIVIDKVMVGMFCALKRAQDEGERRGLRETRSIREIVSSGFGQVAEKGWSLFGHKFGGGN